MTIFKHLIVTGRPACGKSEFIDMVKKMPENERVERLHIGKFVEIDDFPMLWALSEEDDQREAKGEKRIYTGRVPEGITLLIPRLRIQMIPKMNKVLAEKYPPDSPFYKDGTVLIEFARGKADGFMENLQALDPKTLKESAIIHILVTFEESYRRNHARYVKGLESSILSHKVPDKDMYEYFIENDWLKITDNKPNGYLNVNGINVPFVTLNNEPEIKDPALLAKRYEPALKKLMELNQNK
jgi:hypothetical protein